MFALFMADMFTVLAKYEVLKAGLGDRFGYNWEDARRETWEIALKFLGMAFFALITNTIQLSFFNNLAQKVTTSLRVDLYRHFITRDQAFFDKRENSPGELSSVLAKECLIVNTVVSSSYGAVLMGFGSFACGIAIAFSSSWKMALISLACSPLLFASGVIRTKNNKKDAGKQEEKSQESKRFQETCTNMRTVLSMNAASLIEANFYADVDVDNKLTIHANTVHSVLESIA